MSDHSIYYLIKSGDSLESISQKTGIPLNALWNMKSNTFLNVNHLNVGDQIVYKEGVATYENQLYGALSQKPEEPSIFNDPVDRELISRDTINHAALPDDSALPVRAQEVEDSSESQSISHNNEGSNSPTKSCEVCENANMQCLCEVIVEVSKTKDGSSQKYYWISRKENRKAIPKVIVASGFPSGKKLGLEVNGEETTMDYELKGRCEYQSDDECVQSEILTLSAPNGKYESNKTPGGTTGSIDLTYQKNLKLYADINPVSINIYPNRQGAVVEEILRALKLLLLNEADDFPVNYRKLSIAECDTEKNINSEKVVIHCVSLPLYEVEFDLSISFEGEKIESELQRKFDEEGLSPDAARYGRFPIKTKYEIQYNRNKVALELPTLSLTQTPMMNKTVEVFHKLSASKGAGRGSEGVEKQHFPISASFHPPVAHLKVKASFGDVDSLIDREGTIELAPIFGFDIKIDIYELLALAGGALGKAFKKGIKNKFSEVSRTKDDEVSKRKQFIRGDEKGTILRAAGFLYLSGAIDFKGSVKLVPSKLGDLKFPFEEPKLGAEINFGLYAGIYAEARLWGFGGSFNAGLEVATAWEGYYYFEDNSYKIWHKGIWVKAYIEAEFGKKKDEKEHDYGSLNDPTPGELEVDWEGKLMDGGSEDNPFLYSETEQKVETNKLTGDMAINIKTVRESEHKIDISESGVKNGNVLGAGSTGGGGGGGR